MVTLSNAASYTVGECTYGAAILASWIPAGLGNADSWVSRAGSKGLSTGRVPMVGSAMVFNSSYPGSGGYGHVGIVQSIGPNGYPVIEEMNAGRDGGGFGKFDVYQTTAFDVGYLDGYIYPPGSSAPASTTSASLMNASTSGGFGPFSQGSGAWWNPSTWFAPAPAYNPAYGGNPNAGGATGGGTPDLNPADWIATAIKAIGPLFIKGGEVIIGGVVLFVGFYFIMKDVGAPVGFVGKVPGVAGAAAKLGGSI